jgi:hypothetical protein
LTLPHIESVAQVSRSGRERGEERGGPFVLIRGQLSPKPLSNCDPDLDLLPVDGWNQHTTSRIRVTGWGQFC